jgi:hypothetical protein
MAQKIGRLAALAFEFLTLEGEGGGAPMALAKGPGDAIWVADAGGNRVHLIGPGVAELISAVNIALSRATLATCVPADVDGDGVLRINELVSAVARALGGCV